MGRSMLIIVVGLIWFYVFVGFMYWDAYWVLKLPTVEPLARFIVIYFVSVLVWAAWLWRKQ